MVRRKKKTRPHDRQPSKAAKAPTPAPDSEAVEVKAPRRGRLGLALWLAAVAAVAGLFVLLKMVSINAYMGDEHIYIYQAKLVSEGVAPYSGFAMAHPPVQTFFTAILLKLFGYNFLVARLLPAFFCLTGGLVLATMVKRELGSVASVAAMALFILSYEPLRASSHYTGVNMTVALLLSGVLAFRFGAVRASAVFCVLAVFTRLYAAPGVMVLVLMALLEDRKKGLKLIIWGGALGAVFFVAVGLWSGFSDMIHNMVLYHAQKTPMSEGSLADMPDLFPINR